MCANLLGKKPAIDKIGVSLQRISQFLFAILIVGSIINHSAVAQDVNVDKIKSMASSLQKDLADPFKKLELASDIRWLFFWRVNINPTGHEGENQFQEKFKEGFSIFVKTLYSKDFVGAQNRLNKELLDSMVIAYKKNSSQFLSFYFAVQGSSNYFSKKPSSEMINQIIQFVIVLNESGSDYLQVLMKFTGIWPFC